jgi:hypothetical protein
MGDLFSYLLIFTIIKTILSTFFFTVSKFYKNLVKWALTEMLCSVAGTTTLDREWQKAHCLLPFMHQCHVTVQSLSVSLYNRLTKLFWRNLYWKYWNYVLGNENIKRNSRYTIRKNDSLCLRCLHWCFSVFSGVHVTQSLVFYVMFCRSLFVLFPFFLAIVLSCPSLI